MSIIRNIYVVVFILTLVPAITFAGMSEREAKRRQYEAKKLATGMLAATFPGYGTKPPNNQNYSLEIPLSRQIIEDLDLRCDSLLMRVKYGAYKGDFNSGRYSVIYKYNLCGNEYSKSSGGYYKEIDKPDRSSHVEFAIDDNQKLILVASHNGRTDKYDDEVIPPKSNGRQK